MVLLSFQPSVLATSSAEEEFLSSQTPNMPMAPAQFASISLAGSKDLQSTFGPIPKNTFRAPNPLSSENSRGIISGTPLDVSVELIEGLFYQVTVIMSKHTPDGDVQKIYKAEVLPEVGGLMNLVGTTDPDNVLVFAFNEMDFTAFTNAASIESALKSILNKGNDNYAFNPQ